ncbi:MAG: hypothetical protein HOW97_25710 [Catenulispora sp.]|nr:hypothetical protein [Catenulispora sp.]
MPRKQIWSGVAMAAAASAALSGCSLKATDGTPKSLSQLSSLSAQDAVKAAGRAVAAHPGAKVHTVLEASDVTEITDVTATYGDKAALQGTLATVPTGSRTTVSAADGVPIRYADHVMFVNAGTDPSMAAAMGGKAWLRMDLGGPDTNPQVAAIGADVVDNTSPTKGLTMLTAAKDLHKVGEETRGGVQTLHYQGTVSGADAVDPNLVGRGLTQEEADTVSQNLVRGEVSSITYDVWLRQDGLPVAQTFVESASGATLKGAIEFSNWGAGTSVEAVADDQSVDYASLIAKASASASASASAEAASASPSASPSASDSSSASPSASDSSSASTAPSTSTTPSASGTPSTPTPTGTPATPAAPKTPATPATPGSTGSSATVSATS